MEDALQTRQKSRCKELGLIVFGFTLHEAQVEAIHTLFFEQRDLLLLAKTGFFFFQLLPFFTAESGVVLTLMLLTLLQAEQSELINRLPRGRGTFGITLLRFTNCILITNIQSKPLVYDKATMYLYSICIDRISAQPFPCLGPGPQPV